MKKFHSRRLLRIAAGCALLGGCAVAQIDVDVYKGPLANHEDVQVQQFAVMAIGAKPLLVSLRGKLEREKLKGTAHAKTFDTLERNTYYSRYIPRPYSFASDDARQVNDILYLYEDKSIEKAKDDPAQKRARELANRYSEALQTFFRTAGGTMTQSLRDVQGALRNAAGTTRTCPETDSKTPLTGTKDELTAILRDGYRRLLDVPNDRNFVPDCILAVHEAMRASIDPRTKSQVFSDWPDLAAHIAADLKEPNFGFRQLARLAIVEAHAKQLFTSDSPAKSVFVSTVIAMANAFGEARAALHELQNLALSQVAAAPTGGGPEAQAWAKIAANTVGKFNFQAASKKLIESGTDQTVFARAFVTLSPATVNAMTGAEFNSRLLENLTGAGGAAVANSLLALDRQVQSLPALKGTEKETLPALLSTTSGREYGLSRFIDADDWAQAQADAFTLGRLTSDFPGGSLAGGRPNDGIEKLIDDFLKKQEELRKGTVREAIQSVPEFKLLHDALVQFASKVVFVANTDILNRLPGQDEEIRRYVLILQTVGNNILNEGDELRQSAASRERLNESLSREMAGFSSVRPTRIGQMLDDLIAAIRAGAPAGADAASLTELKGKLAAIESALVELNGEIKAKTGTQAEAQKTLTEKQAPCVSAKAQYLIFSDIAGAAKPDTVDGASCHARLATDKLAAIRTAVLAIRNTASLPAGKTAWDDTKARINVLFGAEIASATANNAAEVAETLVAAQAEFAKLTVAATDSTYLAVFASLDSAAVKLFNEANGAWRAAKTQKDGADKAVTDAKGKFDKQSAEKKKIEGELAALLQTSAVARAATIKLIDGARDAVVTAFASAADPSNLPTPQRVVDILVERLPAPAADAGVTAAQAKSIIRSVPLPSAAAIVAAAPAGTSRDVLDQQIAELRYLYLDTVRKRGKEHAESKNIEDAIKVAMEQRANMTYIRPSSAYLRSSFAATGLQDNVGTQRQDLILQQAWNSLPLINGIRTPNQEKDAQTIREIDKQFWQNINRVRVSGTGNTNYAIAKDDVGNWYVKSYKADPEVIFESASQLALFGMGGKLGTNLSGFAKAPAGAAVPLQNSSRTTFERLLDRHTGSFADATEEHRKQIASELADTGLKSKIVAGWKSLQEQNQAAGANAADMAALVEKATAALTSAGPDLDAAREANKPDLKSGEGKPLAVADKGTRIVSALGDAMRFGKKVANAVAAIPPDASIDGEDAEARKKRWIEARAQMADSARAAVGSFLRSVASKRETALRSYNAALTFLGEAATDKPPAPQKPQAVPSVPEVR